MGFSHLCHICDSQVWDPVMLIFEFMLFCQCQDVDAWMTGIPVLAIDWHHGRAMHLLVLGLVSSSVGHSLGKAVL